MNKDMAIAFRLRVKRENYSNICPPYYDTEQIDNDKSQTVFPSFQP